MGGYGKSPLQPFMTFSNIETSSGIYLETFWWRIIVLKTFFSWQAYLTVMVFQIWSFFLFYMYPVNKIYLSIMQVCLHCLDFLAFRWSWSVLSHSWYFSDIMVKTRNPTLRNNLRIEDIRTIFWYQDVITKWCDVIVSFCFPPRKRFWKYYIHCNIFKFC